MLSLRVLLGLVSLTAIGMAQQLPDESYLSLQEKGAWLLNSNHVRADLKVSDGQRQQLVGAESAYSASQQKLFKSSKAPTDAQMAPLDHRYAGAVLGLLSSDQKTRLHQIVLQLAGPRVLLQSDIASQVGLTSDQTAKIKAIYSAEAAAENSMSEQLAKSLSGVTDNAKRTKLALAEERTVRLRSASDAQKALAVLTPTQVGTWKTMLGERF